MQRLIAAATRAHGRGGVTDPLIPPWALSDSPSQASAYRRLRCKRVSKRFERMYTALTGRRLAYVGTHSPADIVADTDALPCSPSSPPVTDAAGTDVYTTSLPEYSPRGAPEAEAEATVPVTPVRSHLPFASVPCARPPLDDDSITIAAFVEASFLAADPLPAVFPLADADSVIPVASPTAPPSLPTPADTPNDLGPSAGRLDWLPPHLLLQVFASGFLCPSDLECARRTCRGLSAPHPCSSHGLCLPAEAARIMLDTHERARMRERALALCDTNALR